MSFEEMIIMLNEKLAPYAMSRTDRMNLANLYHKYPADLVMECIDIGMRQYLRYDENNRPDIMSIHIFLDKLRGILYYRSKPPVIQEMSHIECVGWRRFNDWNIAEARKVMHAYEDARLAAGESQEQIAEGLYKDGYRLLYCVRDWKEWQREMEGYIHN